MIVIILIVILTVTEGYLSSINRLIRFGTFNSNKKVIEDNNLDLRDYAKNIRIYSAVGNDGDDWMSNLVEEPDDDLDDAESIDFLKYLNEQYDKLKGNRNALSFDAFIDWPEIRDVLDDEFLELDDLVRIWNETVGSVQDQCSRSQFLDVNEAIDQAV